MVDLQFKNYHITSNKYGYNVCKMSMEDGKPLFNQSVNLFLSNLGSQS